MRSLYLLSLTVLLALCALYAEGFPSDSESQQPQPTGFFSAFQNVGKKVWSFSGSADPQVEEANNPTGTGSGSGTVGGGAGGLMAGVSAWGSGLVNGAAQIGKAGVDKVAGANYITSPEGNEALKRTASTAGNGLYTGAEEVKKAGEASIKAGAEFVTSPEVKQTLQKTTSTLGNGLYNGVVEVKKAGEAGIKAGTDFIQSGGLDGIITSLGACAQYTLSSLANALAAVDYESLAKSLGIDDLAKAIDDNVDIYAILTKLVLGQAKDPEDGGINYATATLVLQKLLEMVPALKKTIDAFQTVFYVISKVRELKRENKPIDAMTVMREALGLYFKDVDRAFKQKLIDLSPVVYKAAIGVAEAATKVVSTLADRGTIIEALKGIGFKNHVELTQAVITLVVDCVKTVKERNEAKKAKEEAKD